MPAQITDQSNPPSTPTTKRTNQTLSLPDLLAQFGSQRSPTSVSHARRAELLINSPTPSRAVIDHSGNALSNTEQPARDRSGNTFPNLCPPSTTQTTGEMSRNGDVQLDELQKQEPAPLPRRTLRQRPVQHSAPYEIPAPTSRLGLRSSNRAAKSARPILYSDVTAPSRRKHRAGATQLGPKAETSRRKIRDHIHHVTKAKADAFLLHTKEKFLPVLPETNYISNLTTSDITQSYIPYEDLKEQPKGITATLKPYQMKGLSYLAHMHANGMSCMLGDEMGLGKTLQTLSLFQYIEETQVPTDGTEENRPYLVVCPLSVLQSWVNEAERWTPNLKVLRFHGPQVLREELKKVALGKQDKYGAETVRSKKQKNDRRRAAKKDDLYTIGSDDEEKSAEYKIIVTSYETFVAEQEWFKKAFVWRYVVLDEGHKVKNFATNVSNALQHMSSEYRMILTGTPLQNNLTEMWALLHWLYPEIFTNRTRQRFQDSFNLSRGKVDTSFINSARILLELVMLRRMKSSHGVDLNLPPKKEILLYVPLTPMQRFYYTRLLTEQSENLLEQVFDNVRGKEEAARQQDAAEDQKIAELEQLEHKIDSKPDEWADTRAIISKVMEEENAAKKGSNWGKLRHLFSELRKVCSHPYMKEEVRPEPYELGDHIIRASGKYIVLKKLLEDLIVTKRKKVLLFSTFTEQLNMCEDLIAIMGQHIKYLRYDGRTPSAIRNLQIRQFNNKSDDHNLMMISTRAGGLGINLTAATEVIFMDEDWNPQQTLQAEARAHRIGQTQPVTIYKLCTRGTVEEQMMGRIQKKLYLSAKITESMRDGTLENSADDNKHQLNTAELSSIIRRGAQTLAHPEIDVAEMLNWDLDTIIAKCNDGSSDSPSADGNEPAVDEEQWLAGMEKVTSAIFEGKKYDRKKSKKERAAASALQATELNRADRRVGKNTTVEIDGHTVSKNSVGCAQWEAVPTLSGKQAPAEPIAAKEVKKIHWENQGHCQQCWNSAESHGDLYLCDTCPRAIHANCLDKELRKALKTKNRFSCPQHQCSDCSKKVAQTGGLLYHCRWCANGFCEDCLNWQKTKLVGNTIPEFERLSYPAVSNTFYVKCHQCADVHQQDHEASQQCEQLDKAYNIELEQWYRQKEKDDIAVVEAERERVEQEARRKVNKEAAAIEEADRVNKAQMEKSAEERNFNLDAQAQRITVATLSPSPLLEMPDADQGSRFTTPQSQMTQEEQNPAASKPRTIKTKVSDDEDTKAKPGEKKKAGTRKNTVASKTDNSTAKVTKPANRTSARSTTKSAKASAKADKAKPKSKATVASFNSPTLPDSSAPPPKVEDSDTEVVLAPPSRKRRKAVIFEDQQTKTESENKATLAVTARKKRKMDNDQDVGLKSGNTAKGKGGAAAKGSKKGKANIEENIEPTGGKELPNTRQRIKATAKPASSAAEPAPAPKTRKRTARAVEDPEAKDEREPKKAKTSRPVVRAPGAKRSAASTRKAAADPDSGRSSSPLSSMASGDLESLV